MFFEKAIYKKEIEVSTKSLPFEKQEIFFRAAQHIHNRSFRTAVTHNRIAAVEINIDRIEVICL